MPDPAPGGPPQPAPGTASLTGLLHDYGAGWHIEHIDPRSAWAAISRDSDHAEVITAHDLDSLRASLGRAAQGRQPPPG